MYMSIKELTIRVLSLRNKTNRRSFIKLVLPAMQSIRMVVCITSPTVNDYFNIVCRQEARQNNIMTKLPGVKFKEARAQTIWLKVLILKYDLGKILSNEM